MKLFTKGSTQNNCKREASSISLRKKKILDKEEGGRRKWHKDMLRYVEEEEEGRVETTSKEGFSFLLVTAEKKGRDRPEQMALFPFYNGGELTLLAMREKGRANF